LVPALPRSFLPSVLLWTVPLGVFLPTSYLPWRDVVVVVEREGKTQREAERMNERIDQIKQISKVERFFAWSS
jgi:hypothetical protein